MIHYKRYDGKFTSLSIHTLNNEGAGNGDGFGADINDELLDALSGCGAGHADGHGNAYGDGDGSGYGDGMGSLNLEGYGGGNALGAGDGRMNMDAQ